VPGLVLQAASVALVAGYYQVPAVHAALARLSAFREASGVAFSIASTAVFGGLLPFLYVRYGPARGTGARQYVWPQGLCLTAFWAYKGFEVDLWYRIQAHVFGPGHDVSTIALKALVDQFGYCPAFAVPVTAAVYQAVDAGTDWRTWVADLRSPRWYRRRVLPVLISNLGVWVPAVAVIYALPTPFQLPLQNVVLCFYTLVVAHQMRRNTPEGPGGRPRAAAP
jgi:hypothetical protein